MQKSETKSFSWKTRIKSFRWAFEGIAQFFSREHNVWIHLGATILVFFMIIFFKIKKVDLVLLIFSVGFVWVAEMFNTCIENIMDMISPEKQNRVKYIKDLAAAAVFVSVMVAVATGLIIFIPKLF